ncbi:MAG TPA: hypothetical protein VI160_04655 [Gemmatimonadales bacterium]
MHRLGPIVRLQVQRSTLKTGEKPLRRYDPAPILPVSRLAVTPDGMLGGTPDGGWVVDIHHRAHPATKNDDGVHGASVGFTGHYAAIRARFGERVTDGSAGENMIVEHAAVLALADVERGLVVVGRDGGERVRFRVLQPAHPCRPFTGWALGQQVESAVLKEHLQFLDDGMRGYYLQAEGSATIELGDELVAL